MRRGDEVKMPAGRAVVTRVVPEGEGVRIYFRYLRNGVPSQTERNVYEAQACER